MNAEQLAYRQQAVESAATQSLEDFIRGGWFPDPHNPGEWSWQRGAWEILEPGTPLVWNWHLTLLCRELERLTHEKIPLDERRTLVICIAPGLMKSLLVSVFWPVWEWLLKPHKRKMFLANAAELCSRDSMKRREILDSEFYHRLKRRKAFESGEWTVHDDEDPEGWEGWGFKKDLNQRMNYGNTEKGQHWCRPVNGKITGFRADIVVDDPYDAKDATRGSPESIRTKMGVITRDYDMVWRSRLPPGGCMVVIMQRLHPDDLAGYIIREAQHGTRVVALPTEFEPDFPKALGGVHSEDPRTRRGELIHPALYGKQTRDRNRRALKEQYAAQHQQRPTPKEGTLFKKVMFQQRYEGSPLRLKVDQIALTIDCTFKGKASSRRGVVDYNVIQVWGRRRFPSGYFLLDRDASDEWELPQLIEHTVLMMQKWPKASLKLVEDKANGSALLATLKGRGVSGLVPFMPQGDKYERAQISVVSYHAKEVWLPEPGYIPGLQIFIDQHITFPGGSFDDDIDAESQLFIFWGDGNEVGGIDPLKAIEAQLAVLQALGG